MKGINTLQLNEDTMIQAVQEYLNARWRQEDSVPVVTQIIYSHNTSLFHVTIEEKKVTNIVTQLADGGGGAGGIGGVGASGVGASGGGGGGAGAVIR